MRFRAKSPERYGTRGEARAEPKWPKEPTVPNGVIEKINWRVASGWQFDCVAVVVKFNRR